MTVRRNSHTDGPPFLPGMSLARFILSPRPVMVDATDSRLSPPVSWERTVSTVVSGSTRLSIRTPPCSTTGWYRRSACVQNLMYSVRRSSNPAVSRTLPALFPRSSVTHILISITSTSPSSAASSISHAASSSFRSRPFSSQDRMRITPGTADTVTCRRLDVGCASLSTDAYATAQKGKSSSRSSSSSEGGKGGEVSPPNRISLRLALAITFLALGCALTR
mmetsp:Transcript_29328/g.47093  ORF Transcript_29328/g.47093 Transcript_29328/m.47093 type:complete len:221 (+) Transcript_29328:2258-2920(+)